MSSISSRNVHLPPLTPAKQRVCFCYAIFLPSLLVFLWAGLNPAFGRGAGLAARNQTSAAAPTVRFAHGGNAAEIPMQVVANAIFVAARIDGGRPQNWLVDTASLTTSADSDAAREAGAPLGRPCLLSLPGLEIGEPQLDSRPLGTLGPWFGQHVRGVLGDDVIARLVAELDYARLSIELYDPASYRYSSHGAKLDVRWIGGKPAVHARLRLGGRDLDGDFILNTASEAGVVVTSAFLSAHRIFPYAGKTIDTAVVDASGEARLPLARGQSFELGPTEIADPLVAIAQGGKSAAAGWIGGEILRKFRLILDFPSNRVFLEPNRESVFPIPADASGVILAAAGPDLAEFEIRNVLDDSPAAQAGLAPGDRIVAIDNEPASDFTLDQIRNEFCQAGHAPVLTVRRLGRDLKLRIHLRSLL